MKFDQLPLPFISQTWGVTAALFALLSVGLGAYGAHGLENQLKNQGNSATAVEKGLANWDTAAKYQMYHALGLFVIAWLTSRGAPTLGANVAGVCFVLGVLIFSGCLYALVLTGITRLGMIVPIGGLLMMVGWLSLATAFVRSR